MHTLGVEHCLKQNLVGLRELYKKYADPMIKGIPWVNCIQLVKDAGFELTDYEVRFMYFHSL